MVRRPDAVIVNDPTQPPTQGNIKKVVEIKFQGMSLTQPRDVPTKESRGQRTGLAS
jgi:hypothetical protein